MENKIENSIETKEYFNTWSKKLEISAEEIQVEFDELIKDEKEIHPKNTEKNHQKRALQRLAMTYKKQLRSPAIGFEGMVIGVGDLFDTVRKLREFGMDAFRENPQNAISAGTTDEDGNPLDTREVFGTGRENPGFGKPLPEHSYIRGVIGVALRSNVKESPKVFSMTLNGLLAENCIIEMFKPIKFRAINKSEENSKQFILNGSTVTKFEISDTIQMPQPIDVLRKVCGDMFVPFEKIEEYHSINKDDFNRLALIEGDVSIISLEPSKIGSRMMILENMEVSMENIEAPGITCWVPKNINIDFGEGSKVIVIGKTAQGKSRDDPNKLGDVMFNVLGIYAIPEFKIESLTDDNIDKAIKTAQENMDSKVESEAEDSKVEEQTKQDTKTEESETAVNDGW